MPEFNKGDIVRLRSGKVPMEVLERAEAHRRVYVRYTDGKPYIPDYHGAKWVNNNQLVHITGMADAQRCNTLRRRLTADQYDQLCRQCGVSNTHETEDTIMPKLYQTKEETARFGIMIGTNSDGLAVLEMKPGGNIETFKRSDIEEVKPYTVGVKFVGSSSEYHFLSRKGDVQKGDLLIIDGYADMARVTALNTKSDKAKLPLKGRKVMTTPFGQDLSDDSVIVAD